jgi:hypothetical protein
VKTALYALLWLFSFPGIQYTTREPLQVKLFGRNIMWLNRHVGVGYLPYGPGVDELVLFDTMEILLHRTFRAYDCKFCGTTVWSYKKVTICESFSCFCKNGGHWK